MLMEAYHVSHFVSGLLHFSIISSRFTHVVVCQKSLPFLKAE